ncbi:hypothetical protein [Mucilaginibacter polytrichastri]|uniref:Uncharacterized protein n=1 Tax=Mucilaginibacter polytrichastri TaxID=1302689 RepID=A0A1Q6A258_9SPHI|nr:hypothetical protein [Mucilaginibacter polytrichastri]OKS88105.1 hypothetical protein RG47T_3569 [Mucilaginibacter polytrichastri]SFT09683.1 hypothetical protein SAMN04487890_110136 [Mucilaginibacter polytrichastri]
MEIKQTPENALSHSTVKAIINAPIEKVNIADWLFNLPDEEYQACSSAHIAAGFTRTFDGTPMSINVETIGTALIIQHYVATEYRPDYCRMLSVSDAITTNGRSKVQVLWELKVTKLDDHTCEYDNEIHATATPEFLEYIKTHNISLAQAANERQIASDAHNHEETPLFAKSIEKKAMTGNYGI